VLGISIIKVNDHFTLNDIALVDKLKYNMLSISQLVNTDLDVFFANLVLVYLILLPNLFVTFLALGRFLVLFLICTIFCEVFDLSFLI
jgi:hypothetical protein